MAYSLSRITDTEAGRVRGAGRHLLLGGLLLPGDDLLDGCLRDDPLPRGPRPRGEPQHEVEGGQRAEHQHHRRDQRRAAADGAAAVVVAGPPPVLRGVHRVQDVEADPVHLTANACCQIDSSKLEND